MYFRCDSIKVRAFRFCERILRFSQAKILRFFLWLSAKYVKMHFDTVSTRVHLIFYTSVKLFMIIFYNVRGCPGFDGIGKSCTAGRGEGPLN